MERNYQTQLKFSNKIANLQVGHLEMARVSGGGNRNLTIAGREKDIVKNSYRERKKERGSTAYISGQSLRTALRARKKFGFIDGTLLRPKEGSADLEDWWTNNSLLVSWIMNTVEPALRSTISHMEVAQDLWDDMKERFSIMNGPRIQQLKAELIECKQKGLTIIPSCKCGLCTCNLGSMLEKKREEEKVHQFLTGLDEIVYTTVRSNLRAQDPLPTLNKVYSTLVQEERVHTVTLAKDEKREVMAFAVQGGSRYKDKIGGKENIGTCIHCNRPGHDSESCFQIIGYPEWWENALVV
ncbi:hypothetical protein V8G54_011026 [Vigna mungo]|uniref:CCHC-type domain-containing protein n=1 Tax=Vigna mungo TaxID=3915 RepID=A0AAQ3NP89_VIGMU